MAYAQHIQRQNNTSASEIPTNRKSEMYKSNSGAALFKIDDWAFLRRCLITGTSSNSYYAGKFQMTEDFERVVISCAKEDAIRTADMIREVSHEALAVKVDSCIFALLILSTVSPSEFLRIANDVIRTQSHFHLFMSFVKGGKGESSGYRGMGKTIQTFGKNWFENKPPSWLAFQALKYPQRNGFKVRDELRLFHPNPKGDEVRDNLFGYIVEKPLPSENFEGLEIIKAYEWLKSDPTPANAIKAIQDHKLSFEMVAPLGCMNDKVWNQLFQTMPVGATLRNLGNLSTHNVFDDKNNCSLLRTRLTTKENLKKARVHPYDILVANKIYRQGGGKMSRKTWTVKNHVSNTLDIALETSFDSLDSTGQTYFFAIDVSHSMTSPIANGIVNCAEVATTMALASAKAEEDCYIYGFKHILTDLHITSRDTFSAALTKASRQNFGSTNAGSVYEYAIKNNLYVDTFAFFTDCESFGGQQAFQLLNKYRKAVNPNARAVYCALEPYWGSLADPKDAGSLTVEGFDPTAVKLIQQFSLGKM